ncbi:MAG: chorismate synthase, partial [Alloprevotella sp.]|nr:chorismate synthase [Alloprevotella sp.]
MNTFGELFRLTTFGESHGPGVGGVIDGMPPGVEVDLDFIQHELDRRRPGQSALTTARKEGDKVEILSGVFEGKTTGCPIGFLVRNENQHSNDYDNLRNLFRPSHADFTYFKKYGLRDHRGGGRTSARETIARVVGGAFAKLALRRLGISITAYTSQVGHIALSGIYADLDLSLVESNPVRCPDEKVAAEMAKLIA